MATVWPQDNQKALIAFYGDPETGEVERQLVRAAPPFRMTYEGTPVKQLVFHENAIVPLYRALERVWEYYGKDQAKVDSLGISKTAGTYNKRKIAGSDKWSNHAFGAAIDINSDDNGFYKGHGNIPTPLIAAFKAEGARWGGDYHGRTDPMHFEFCDSGEPRQTFEEWLTHYGAPLPQKTVTPTKETPVSTTPATPTTPSVHHLHIPFHEIETTLQTINKFLPFVIPFLPPPFKSVAAAEPMAETFLEAADEIQTALEANAGSGDVLNILATHLHTLADKLKGTVQEHALPQIGAAGILEGLKNKVQTAVPTQAPVPGQNQTSSGG